MAKLAAPSGTVHEIFALPLYSTVVAARFYLDGQLATVAVTGPTKVNATSSTHEFYQMSYVVPAAATNRKVYQCVVDWRDPSGTLQPPLIFECQVVVDASSAVSISIIK